VSRHRRPRTRARATAAQPVTLLLLAVLALVAVVTGALQVGTATAPASAVVPSVNPFAGRGGTGGTEDVDAPGGRAVRLQRVSELAAATYETARARSLALAAHADTLAARAAEAAELTEEATRRAESARGLGVVDAIEDLYAYTSLDAAADAAANQAHATRLADLSRQEAQAAEAAALDARADWRRAERRAAEVQVAGAARAAARAAIEVASFGRDYRAGSDEQDRRNRRALAAWHDYLRDLAAAEVVPPVAAVLADPAALPEPYRPVAGPRGEGVPGVALVDRFADSPLVVLPAETVEAVSQAFRRVGTREPARSTGVAAAECGGLVEAVWAPAGMTLAPDAGTQLRALAPVAGNRTTAGDVLFLGGEAYGVRSSTVALADDLMIGVDPATGRVGVERIERRELLAAARVAAPSSTTPVPESPGCGIPLAADVPSDTVLWSAPLGASEGVLSADYGDSGSLWSSGSHTGQDFAAPLGTPVQAMRGGTVTVENPDWAGNLVRVDHGGGVETWYAHLDSVDVTSGDEVTPGTQLGTVGSEGNSTGPHLHLELRLDGEPIDPLVVLKPAVGAAATDGYANGELPADALCAATAAGGLLRCDAAVSLRLLAAAYEAELGEELCLTDTYRSRAGQAALAARKPMLAAVPGTSMHGWGLAVDACGGAEEFGSPEHDFLSEQGPSYGWVHPGWAGSGGSKPEPWHFEFVGAATKG
jgi:murein DD-endopeptidase MepM/ murein hydrolase activator NlpD